MGYSHTVQFHTLYQLFSKGQQEFRSYTQVLLSTTDLQASGGLQLGSHKDPDGNQNTYMACRRSSVRSRLAPRPLLFEFKRRTCVSIKSCNVLRSHSHDIGVASGAGHHSYARKCSYTQVFYGGTQI